LPGPVVRLASTAKRRCRRRPQVWMRPAAVKHLPAEAREVSFLRFYDGLSYDRISAVLGISEQAINGRLRRAKKQLGEHLRRCGFDEVDL